MRGFILAAILLATSVAFAQTPGRPYRLYVFDAADGATIYGVQRSGAAAAVEIENGQATVLAHAAARLRAARAATRRGDTVYLYTDGADSQIQIGDDGDVDEDRDREDDEEDRSPPRDSLVEVRNASAAQARDFVGQIRWASAAQRQQMLSELGL